MYQNNLLLPSVGFFIIVVVFLISSVYADKLYDSCSPPSNSSCGFVKNVTYPFWDGRLPDHCSHPTFKLNCDNNTLSINIKSQTYYILDINYVAKVFTITKPEFTNGPCPVSKSLLKNTTINSNLFELTSDSQTAILFYDCSPPRLVLEPPYGFRCAMDTDYGRPSTPLMSFNSDVGYLAVNDQTWEKQLRKNCSFEVDIPILRTEVAKIATGLSNINNILKGGFKVKWLIDDGKCDGCKKSKGRCGYNQSLEQPTCLCKNGVHDPSGCNRPYNHANAPTGN